MRLPAHFAAVIHAKDARISTTKKVSALFAGSTALRLRTIHSADTHTNIQTCMTAQDAEDEKDSHTNSTRSLATKH
ncbi:hypothetical protein Mag101_07285 [Microbulbifer agarilyticus]|uniref:Uncharacterized protein n=1 Tax=Microbulbifer agarilyticus TaxID=260552 RepID=A0A1Q2M432_9GAMM|nr:hypothetical protein Mag101_07285 [Microbulbifer agarilyticus]